MRFLLGKEEGVMVFDIALDATQDLSLTLSFEEGTDWPKRRGFNQLQILEDLFLNFEKLLKLIVSVLLRDP